MSGWETVRVMYAHITVLSVGFSFLDYYGGPLKIPLRCQELIHEDERFASLGQIRIIGVLYSPRKRRKIIA